MKSSRDILKKYIPKFQECKMVNHCWNAGEFIELPEPMMPDQVKCPMCGSSEGYPVLDSFRENFLGWSCKKQECISQKLSTSSHRQNVKPVEVNLLNRGVPESLLGASFDKISQEQKTIESLKKFCETFRGFLLLAGSAGTGKSYASVCCMRKLLEKTQKSCRFVNVADLYVQWLYLKKSGETELNLLEKFGSCDLLVLDDLGTRTPTESFLDFLYILLNQRCSKLSTGTIVSTNLNQQELGQKVGEQLLSRLMSGIIIKFSGNDKRRLQF